MKKTHKANESPVVYGVHENRTASDSHELSSPILNFESDAFVARLKEMIGDESNSAFARNAHIGEGTLRNILAGAWPRTDNLVAIADAGGVTIDWLATGRLPKRRSDLKVSDQAPAPLNPELLRMALILAEDSARVQPLSAEQRADMVLAFYNRLNKGNSQ